MKPKTIKIIYWVTTILFSLGMLFGAITELMQNEQSVKVMKDLGYPAYLNYIIGTAKILGVIAIIQWKYMTIKEWAYSGFMIDIVGATASIYFAGQGLGMALVATVPFLFIMFVSYFLSKKAHHHG